MESGGSIHIPTPRRLMLSPYGKRDFIPLLLQEGSPRRGGVVEGYKWDESKLNRNHCPVTPSHPTKRSLAGLVMAD